MATNPVNPLDWRVPIVNPDGTPTNEFQRKWAQQAAVNSDVIPLDTPAEVSAVLDVIDADPNSILVRGSTLWEGWTPGASKIIVTNASGVLSALVIPNDNTKFLDGTGTFVTLPAVTGFLPLTGGALSGPGNLTMAGYLGVGSASAPTHTTPGDVTGLRGFFEDSAPAQAGFKLEVAYKPTAFPVSGAAPALSVEASGPGDAGGLSAPIAANISAILTGSANAAQLLGVNGAARWQSTGTPSVNITGCFYTARVEAAATVTVPVSGLIGQIIGSSSAVINDARALVAGAPSLSGGATVPVATGVYVNAQKIAGVTKGYGVRSLGTSDLNIVAGALTLGGTSDPTTSASFDMQSTTGALYPPRLTTAQKNALTPQPGFIVQDTTLNALQQYQTSGGWQGMGSSTGGGAAAGGPITIMDNLFNGSSAWPINDIILRPIYLNAGDVVTALGVFFAAASGPANWKVGIYSGDLSGPTNLVAVSPNQVGITANVASIYNFPTPLTITVSGVYWVGAWTDTTTSVWGNSNSRQAFWVQAGGVWPSSAPAFSTNTNGAATFAVLQAGSGIDLYSPPAAASFTLTSVGAPTVAPSLTDVPNLGMVFSGGSTITTTDNIQLATQNIPSVPFTKSVRFRLNCLASRSRGFGMCLYDGTKVKTFGYLANASGAGLVVANYTNTTTFSAYALNDAANPCWNAFQYFRIQDDGTNWIYQVSSDGQNWTRFFQEARNTFLTATKIGLWFDTADVASSIAAGDIPSASIQDWF